MKFQVYKRKVCTCLPRYGCIFLFLVVFALSFVIDFMDILENTVKSTIHSSYADRHYDFCKFQPLSLKETREEHLLLKSIAWPETPPLPFPHYLSKTSDPSHSSFTILSGREDGEWHKDDNLEILIKMYDFQGLPKKFGGDVLLARLHNPTLGAGVVGQVVDHLNGSYSAVFYLPWEGNAEVEVTLVHPSEAITVLRSLTRKHPDRIYFKSFFRSGYINETTVCNVCLRPTQQPVCNYTDLSTGEPWFCYKPKNLSCDTRINHSKGRLKKNLMTTETLFQSDVNMKVSIPASGPSRVTVLPKTKDLKEFNLHSQKKIGPYMALDYVNNILVTYRCHGPPIRFSKVPISELRYIANELDSLTGGSDTVVVLGIWSHFSTFPVEVYIRRLQSIRRAVVRLLSRAPDTLVVIRTANPKNLTLYETITNSDWYSLQRDKVLRAMFKGLNVHLVDAWEMVMAHNLPHELHPQPPIIENMINVLLSYICPKKGG
ncbi:NXPE family member 3-like isoform X2 [Pundamilia nyererei]|uniref:NXPE family member 3-like isoform X2 n=1 Tax=Pundamilia nyererei TaxID=303518 RepID=A0A9Y6MBE5_9CICH|nr:PREDICTED: NXPE family member 3-like isoform X2 [Pundamilia nyererei]